MHNALQFALFLSLILYSFFTFTICWPCAAAQSAPWLIQPCRNYMRIVSKYLPKCNLLLKLTFVHLNKIKEFQHWLSVVILWWFCTAEIKDLVFCDFTIIR